MDWLTAKDWDDLRSLGTTVAMFAAMAVGLEVWKHFRSKPGDRLSKMSAGDFAFIALIVGVSPLMNILERHGFSSFWIVPLGALLAFPMIWAANRRIKAAQVNAIDNPNAAAAMPKVPLSAEEKRVSVKTNALLIGFAIVTIGPICWLAFSGVKLGASGAGWLFLFVGAILVAMIYGMVGRWPGSITIQSSVEIDATPRQIWDEMVYRETDAYYSQMVRRVERLKEPGEVFLLHYFNINNCTDCGLPQTPDAPGKSNRVEVIEARAPDLYRIRSSPQGMGGKIDTMMDYEDETFLFDALPSGGSRVTNINTVAHPRVWLAALLKLGDPLGEHLRNLKAHMEGVPGDTVWHSAAARIAAARCAPKFCGCPPEAFAGAVAA